MDLVVPEAYIQSIRIGQQVDVRIPAAGDQSIPGTVDVIVPSADQGSRTFIVQVAVSKKLSIKSGMFARARLSIGEREMLRIPVSSVVQQGQLTGVYIVDDTDTARFRLIRTGHSHDNQVEVISGIRENTRLVVTPPALLTNGSPVEFEK